MSNGYPFTTRKQIIDRITSEPAFAVECVRLVDERRGWMASHKARAAKAVAQISSGNLSPEDLAAAVVLLMPYARTISRILREREMAERPELTAQAAVFGVVRPAMATPVGPESAVPTPVVDATATEVPATPTKRRPGRPKGSRNRVREEEPAPKRHRRRS